MTESKKEPHQEAENNASDYNLPSAQSDIMTDNNLAIAHFSKIDKAESPNIPMVMMDMALKYVNRVFCDQHGMPYLELPDSEGRGNFPIQSQKVRNWLVMLYAQFTNQIVDDSSAKKALNLLAYAASISDERYELHLRFAYYKGAVYVNLRNPSQEIITINKDGFKVLKIPPVPMFKIANHLLALPYPIPGGDIKVLLQFANIADPAEQLLFLVDIVITFLPVAAPIRLIVGPKGSAKTTLASLRKKLTDPSSAELLRLPDSEAQAIEIINHNQYMVFDNVSKISESLSNLLCQVVTGGSYMKRKLYTDSDSIIYNFKGFRIDLTATKNIINQPDLLDRSRLIELNERILDRDRIPESEFWNRFEAIKPKLLGAIFDLISKAMGIYPTVNPEALPRLADYGKWGEALAIAMGHPPGYFLKCFFENQQRQSLELMDADPVAKVLKVWLNTVETEIKDGLTVRYFKGSATELFQKFRELLIKHRYSHKDFPRSAQSLSRALGNIASDLSSEGIEIHPGKSGGLRYIEIKQVLRTQGNQQEKD
jgi:hypothetical protein